MESLLFEPEIVDSLLLQDEFFFISTFTLFGLSTPPSAVFTTLARIALHPDFRIASASLVALYNPINPNPPAFALLPSPIFPSSSPNQQYSGHSFLSALTKKLRIVFSEFQRHLPTDPSHLSKFIQFTNDNPHFIKSSLDFCVFSLRIQALLLRANPPIEVDSEIIRELLLFVKEAHTTILTNISNIDTLIASLPSDSTRTTPLVSEDDTPMTESLIQLRDDCEDFVRDGWSFIANLTFSFTDPHKSLFQTIILNDPSFPDLILNSLKLTDPDIRLITVGTLTNITNDFPWMRAKFMTANLVDRMFETVDFVSLPLSESETLFYLTHFITWLLEPIGDDEEAKFKQYRFIRVSVFEPAKKFFAFIFHNSDTLTLNELEQTQLERHLCRIHNHIKNMELLSDEHDPDFVSDLVRWEMQTMVEMENEGHFRIVFKSLLNRTQEWNRDKPERQKRREVHMREEGWDDAFELRVVGIEMGTKRKLKTLARKFRIELTFNADEL
ncbi:hypothetical protein BLNAU_22364 [Blattamonas nauphoetae]|uniref:Uncharacterized protein n=1 Tax=Blattamonas nauphoetae TaxID=2049346 RepID=A0ABQ9WT97_9EUKA|nr:hypothetical protein BLNAU_22364 [Blattamonas nauphoetae]